ncbi:amidohydrolase family protein [Antarctobacter sp.]|uniref:amidohydrolase family protein n=1 Tax=Antarctobacter sp. TaxID=1872577 RepID=UPI003A955AB1
MTNFLIKNAEGILTGKIGQEARAKGDIRVRDGVIAELGNLEAKPGEKVIDAGGCVVTPGLVNSHHHLFQSCLKAVPSGMNETLAAWLRLVPVTHWPYVDEDVMRVSAKVGMAELVLSGATTVSDHHYFYSDRYDYDPSEVLFDVAGDFGTRFVLARGSATKTRKYDGDNSASVPTESLEQMLESVAATAQRWHDPAPDSMRRVALAPTTPTFSVDIGELKEIRQAGRDMGLRLHSHLSENKDYANYTLANYKMRPVHWLAEHDWLGEDVWFAHMVDIDESEVKVLAETGTGMSHCPQANARLGSGIAPTAALHAAGGTVSLAVDGAAANEAADMGTTLYLAFALPRAANQNIASRAETVLSWATAGGGKVLGLDTIGTIEVGKSADIAIFDLDTPRYFGQHDAVISPVISAGDLSVRHSFVQGRPLVENGKIPWLDLTELRHEARRVVEKLKSIEL